MIKTWLRVPAIARESIDLGVKRRPLAAHSFAEAGDFPVDRVTRGLGSHIARGDAGTACGKDDIDVIMGGEANEFIPNAARFVWNDGALESMAKPSSWRAGSDCRAGLRRRESRRKWSRSR